MNSPLRICFLVSGNGGSLKVVHQAAQRLGLPWEICSVLADRECGALAYAQAHGIRSERLRYTRQNPQALQAILQAEQPDLVVTNIHKIIDADTLAILPGQFINLHYSILPAFKGFIGLETLAQAAQLNVGIVGATCHSVDEEVDNGRVLAQCGLPADWSRDSQEFIGDLIFRGAGLALLQGIITKAGPQVPPPGLQSIAQVIYKDKPLIFSPALQFEAARLDEDFWQQLK
jgi:phosphoribosylglycinamide formyltransferase-1